MVPEGQLITVKNLPNKQSYNKGQSNYWFDGQKNIFYFREHGQKKEKSIQLSFEQGKYSHEGVSSSNIYEIIVRTSIFSSLFGSTSSGDCLVAVTEESLKLPFEEQPWFIGAVDKGELKSVELGETRMFFTRAKGPRMYLHWTTTKKMKTPGRPILLESNDLSLVLPRDEFMTAMYNGGTIRHRNEVLFCRRIMENNLEGAKNIFSKGVNLASLVLRDPNIISYYIENTPLESINEELLMWLLESGVPVDRDDKEIINAVASKCSDIVIEALLEHGVKITQQVAQRAITRNIPPHRMRIYFKSLISGPYISISDYFKMIKDCKDTDYTNRVLVTLAWRYGNDDNLFKQLPKELVQHIVSFGVDDEYPWLDYVDSLNLAYLTHIDYHYRVLSLGELIKLAVIGWHYWAKLDSKSIDFIFLRLIDNKQSYYTDPNFYENLSPSQMNHLVSWLIKLSTRQQFDHQVFVKSSLMTYLLNNEKSLPVVKSLLDARVIKREWWLEPADFVHWLPSSPVPLSWHTVKPVQPHKSLIQLLIRENLMPEQCTLYNRAVGLSAYLRRNGNTAEVQAVIDFIAECRNNSNHKALN